MRHLICRQAGAVFGSRQLQLAQTKIEETAAKLMPRSMVQELKVRGFLEDALYPGGYIWQKRIRLRQVGLQDDSMRWPAS